MSKLVSIKASELGKTSGTERKSEKQMCGLCNEKMALRECIHCPDTETKLFCVECFKSYHAKGARKRHDRKTIIYDEDASLGAMSSPMKS